MRIAYASDLHLDIHDLPSTVSGKLFDYADDLDVIVLNGDISTANAVGAWCADIRKETGAEILFTPGNHEYYYMSLGYSNENMAFMNTFDGLHYLNNTTRKIGDVTFIGSTLWTNFKMNEIRMGQSQQVAAEMARSSINDFDLIRRTNLATMTTDDVIKMHAIASEYIEVELKKALGKVVVITHFSPSPQLEKRFMKSDLSAYFSTDMEYLMSGPDAPDYWIYGHTHDPVPDMKIGDTQVISNMRGYPGELEWDGLKVIEL